MRRAILGGTFDPPHLAHLVAGEAAYRQLDLDVVTFLPAGRPWQKSGRRVTSPEHRWEMTRRAVEGVEYFEADPREVHRDGPTYTVETLASYPEGEEVLLVLGADVASRIRTWHRWQEVVARARVVVAPRPGTDRRQVEEELGKEVRFLDMPLLPLSGTALRRRAAAGGTIRFLVPEGVWRYTLEHGIYGPG